MLTHINLPPSFLAHLRGPSPCAHRTSWRSRHLHRESERATLGIAELWSLTSPNPVHVGSPFVVPLNRQAVPLKMSQPAVPSWGGRRSRFARAFRRHVSRQGLDLGPSKKSSVEEIVKTEYPTPHGRDLRIWCARYYGTRGYFF
mgnify:CR=1 FL=1